jgi:phosphate-selective porin OprO/OprP
MVKQLAVYCLAWLLGVAAWMASAGQVQAQPSSPAVGAGPGAARVSAGFGQGVAIESDDRRFSLNLRARFQTRVTYLHAEGDASADASSLEVRRAQLILAGRFFGDAADYYLQVGFGSRDADPVAPVPLRDAFVTWHMLPHADLRFGQMRVPYERQLMTSSSALQLVDRSIVASEFGLDRDAGIQLLHSDVGQGHRRFAYHLGAFSGDGRNHESLKPGFLYLARLTYLPWGAFDELSEGDLERSTRPRAALSVAGAYNRRATRARSTAGDELALGSFDFVHAAADAMWKCAGWSLSGEFLVREVIGKHARARQSEGQQLNELARAGMGGFVQGGKVIARGIEVSARYGRLAPRHHEVSALHARGELGGGLSWYLQRHDLKVQADYFWLSESAFGHGHHQARLQVQLYL